MARILLTGGSGFMATHILENLLKRGYSVVTTVRNSEKAENIKRAHPTVGKDKLDFVIVPDVSQPDAFEAAVVSEPPFEAVIHTASPFHYNVTDIQKDLLDPAINGTTGILKAIVKSAPTVKRVVITSSFGAITNPFKGLWPEHEYSEEDWNPLTQEQAVSHPARGYQASKTFAEKAAWDFLEETKPNFTLATINPPLVFGPAIQGVGSLKSLNTSSQYMLSFISGPPKEEIPPTMSPIWVDVRDVALAHILAAELPDAANKRFFVTAGYFSNREVVDIIRKNFPEYHSPLPPESAKGGDMPEGGVFKINNKRSINILGLNYRSLENCVVDTISSFKSVKE
ncbi:Glycine-rich RNA-binding protein 2, mitochondrial [Diaporthe australafricana]|uniref:Glycine-rich RNA-binding protein 2, mitochondrial n=1 Tax=Diaporthe australafricana TaxID=127596 RepID=A0ABR3WSY7_9PEZI